MARGAKKSRRAGFTLLEMMIVMIVIGILISIALPIYTTSLLRSREDKQKAPQGLDDLVQGGYLKVIPKDPMTNEANWEVVQEDILLTADQQDPGISDVHSASSGTATDGTAYSTW